MKFKLSLLHVVVASCLGLISLPTWAQNQGNATSNNKEDSQIATLSSETKQLQMEVALLESQLKKNSSHPAKIAKKLSSKNKSHDGKPLRYAAVASSTATDASIISSASSANGNNSYPAVSTTAQAAANTVTTTTPTSQASTNGTSDQSSSIIQPVNILGTAPLYVAGIPVIVSPYLGVPPAYDASDLIASYSLINSDLLLLQERQTLENLYNNNGLPVPTNTFMALSGLVTGQVTETRPYNNNRNSDIDLSALDFDYIAGMGPWITLLVTMDYDNIPPSSLIPAQLGPRTINSRIFLDQGFFTIGNLNRCNFYFSIGQMYVPFGQYGSYLVGSPLTSSMGETKARTILVGYNHTTTTHEFDAQVYVYKGDSITRSITFSQINEGGINLDYYINEPNWSTNIGGGFITNIADSASFQLNGNGAVNVGNDIFGGFASSPGFELLAHRAPALDLHGSLTLGKISFESEYITVVRSFAMENLSFNDANNGNFKFSHNAKPRAFDLESSYKFDVLGRPSAVSIGYGFSRQALALLIPAQIYGATISTSIWRSTTQSLGVVRSVNYSVNDHTFGQTRGANSAVGRLNLSKTSDAITLQMSVLF